MAVDRAAAGPCIVLGGGITALGVVRSLGRAGLRPILVAPPGDVASRSRHAAAHISDIPESADPAALEQGLSRHGVGRCVLFPCSDTWAQAVARVHGEHPERFLASTSEPDVLELLVDKVRFAETLERLDVPHPATRLLESADTVVEAELDGYFLKPSNSQRFNQRYSDKAITFGTRDEAREGLRKMDAVGVSTLLQEYIPGPPTCHYFVDGYLGSDGALHAVFVRRRTRMYPLPYGNSTHMVTVPPETVGDAVPDIVRLLRGIGFHGTFSGEFKRDPRDGLFKLLEVNGRSWWYIGFAAACGIDTAQLAYGDALGEELPPPPSYRAGERCVLLHLDMRAFLYERRVRGLSFPSWLRSVVGASSTVFSWDDPRPALFLNVGMARTWLQRATATMKELERGR